jgi:hypothetical protein
MRKYILGSVIFLSLVSSLHGMENNLPAQQQNSNTGITRSERGAACTALIPEPQPFFVGGFVMYPGGRLVPYTSRNQINFMVRMLRRPTPRKGLEPAQFKKIALPQPRPKQPRYRNPLDGLRPLPSEHINLAVPLDIKTSIQKRPQYRDQDGEALFYPTPKSAEELRKSESREAYEDFLY